MSARPSVSLQSQVIAMPSSTRLSTTARLLAGIAIATSLAGCSAVDRIKNVGETPKLSAIENPKAEPGYKPVQMPMPEVQPAVYNNNSLWRTGTRQFFKDQRAQRVGDLVTVKVRVTDKAIFDNQTKRTRTNKEDSSLDKLFGLEKPLNNIGIQPAVEFNTNMQNTGTGQINRSEQLLTNVAAVVTQQLPNGNLVVEGKQEIRVNAEVREIIVAGVIRPEDIESDNTVDSTKIAYARIGYGGRGQITDIQQPRYGHQVLDIILPF